MPGSVGLHVADIGDDGSVAFPGNQYSQIEIGSTEVIGTEWDGVAVRVRNGGQDAYVGVCKRNNRKTVLMLFKVIRGKWTKLDGSYISGPLAAGTKLRLVAVGSTIAFMENGTQRVAVGDSSLSGGVPGLMISIDAQENRWSSGMAGFEIQCLSTDRLGIATYGVISPANSGGPCLLRVLRPTAPVPGIAHNFLFVLPVEKRRGSTFGDGLQTLRSLDAANKFGLTIIEPSFCVEPWYADNPANPDVRHETFMTRELVSWAQENLARTGSEQNWLIGFSKSGIGGQYLLLKHPDIFALAASWDFPANMSSYDEYGSGSAACYGDDANFQASYRLTRTFVNAHRAPFLEQNRIWIGGGKVFGTDVSDYGAVLTSEGICHSAGAPMRIPHRWDSGWVPMALDALHRCSVGLLPGAAGLENVSTNNRVQGANKQ